MVEKRCDNCLVEYHCSWEPAGNDGYCKNWKPEYQDSPQPSREEGAVKLYEIRVHASEVISVEAENEEEAKEIAAEDSSFFMVDYCEVESEE